MKNALPKLNIFLNIIFLLSLFGGIFFFYTLFQKVNTLESRVVQNPNSTSPQNAFYESVQSEASCGQDCKSIIQEEVQKALSALPQATPSSQKSSTPSSSSSQSAVKQTTYVPLAGPISTTSTDWTDAPGTEVYIDVTNDYGKDTYISWDAQLKIANANGLSFARLFDATHGIAVDGSEVSVATSGYSQGASGRIYLWQGRNLYKVQIKSLNSNEATFGSGRIKITY